jgi:hypothetical protein
MLEHLIGRENELVIRKLMGGKVPPRQSFSYKFLALFADVEFSETP